MTDRPRLSGAPTFDHIAIENHRQTACFFERPSLALPAYILIACRYISTKRNHPIGYLLIMSDDGSRWLRIWRDGSTREAERAGGDDGPWFGWLLDLAYEAGWEPHRPDPEPAP